MASANVPYVSAAELRRQLIPRRVPQSALHRRYYGGSVDMLALESAVQCANVGLMADLCDLESETMGVDPHLSGILAKRFGVLQAAEFDVVDAQGDDLDKKLAKAVGDDCRNMIRNVRTLGERIYELAWGLYDGRSAHELHWDLMGTRPAIAGIIGRGAGPKWQLTGLQWLHPRTLSFGPSRELRHIDDAYATRGYFNTDGFALDDFPGKFLSYTPRLFREYQEREGLGPRCLYWSFFKRFSWRMRMKLTEIFGLPWRIVSAEKDTQLAADALENAQANVEMLGLETTARVDAGIKVDVITPELGSQDFFGSTSEECDAQQSKLVLGQIGTTDGAPAGLNSNTTGIMKGEQDILFQRDGSGLSARLTEAIFCTYVALKYGPDMVPYAPSLTIRTQGARDRKAEIERAEKVISMGLRVAVPEVRDIAGLREPDEEEAYVEGIAGGGFRVVDPLNMPEEEEVDDSLSTLVLAPTDIASVVRVDEARASVKLPRLGPDNDGDLMVDVYRAKHGIIGQAEGGEEAGVSIGAGFGDGHQLEARAVEISAEENHGHALTIYQEDIQQGVPRTYTIKGAADHEHFIILRGEHFALLASGSAIQVPSSTTNGHRHMLRIEKVTRVQLEEEQSARIVAALRG